MSIKSFMLVALLVLPFGGLADQTQTQKPIKVIQPHIDGHSVPVSIEQLVESSELVVLGTVVAERPADRTLELPPDPGTYTFVRTAYRLKLQEIFLVPERLKPGVSSIEVGVANVGDRDRGDHIARYVSETARALQVGETYLLFLRAGSDEVWRLATDSGDSVLAIRGPAVAPQAASPLAMGLGKKSWFVLRRELLAIVKKEVSR